MTHKLREWMGHAKRLESAISRRVDAATQRLASTSARQPLEIIHQIVSIVEREIQPAGRGQRLFPYTHIRVWLMAPTPKARAQFEAACDAPPSLKNRIHERLASEGCVVDHLAVTITYVTKPRADWAQPEYHVDFSRDVTAAAPAPVPHAIGPLSVTVTRGTVERATHTLATGTLTLGRGSEVRDARERVLRVNNVAFLDDGSEVNLTVSRRHAHIARDAGGRAYRLHDDGSEHDTRVLRDGRGVPVPRGRGLRLRNGDVIVLGQARLEVTLTDDGGGPV
ncbi:MAG: FHA domain-containing protein [Acidobacteriota bacterium]